jgi:hypothetical protein
MLNDIQYDKTKLLYKLSKLCWFLEKHAIENAQKDENKDYIETLQKLKKDLDAHIEKLKS